MMPPLPEKVSLGVGYFDETIFGHTEAQMTEYGKACYEAGLAENPEPEATVVAYSDTWLEIIDKYQRPTQLRAHPPCSRHPDAPHGFDRSGSHNAGRYVCLCEHWSPGESS